MESFLDIILEEEQSNRNIEVQNSSMWLIDKDVIQPTTSIKITNKLFPGIYLVDEDRNGVFCKKINVEIDNLYKFSDSLIIKLVNEINNFWDKKDLYNEKNLIHKRGILLEGYPGTGKTSIISLISNEIINKGGVVFKVSSPRNLLIYINFIQNYFRKIESDTPVITIIEDVDKYEGVEAELLDFLDGKSQINHHVVIATSNNTEQVSNTLLRPSRLDLCIEIPLPNKLTREEYFINKNVPNDLLNDLVKATDGMSLADLKEIYICVFLLDYSIEDAINKILSPHSKQNYLNVKTKSISL